MIDGRELGIPTTNFKYDKLSKEHELLKEKLDKTLKELEQEKQTRKAKTTTTVDDSKSEERKGQIFPFLMWLHLAFCRGILESLTTEVELGAFYLPLYSYIKLWYI